MITSMHYARVLKLVGLRTPKYFQTLWTPKKLVCVCVCIIYYILTFKLPLCVLIKITMIYMVTFLHKSTDL